LDALAQLLNISAQQVAQDGPNETTCADQKESAQNTTRLGRAISFSIVLY
jgi:hypothetical protein